MGELLEEAKKNRTKHNLKMLERARELEAEAEDFEAEAEELLLLMSTYEAEGKTERPTKDILVRGKIKLTVYMELSGEQQELLARINRVYRDSKRKGKDNTPDIKDAMDAACELCASLVVPEDGRPWHKVNTWAQFLKMTNLESVMDVLSELLKPYEDHCKKIQKFR